MIDSYGRGESDQLSKLYRCKTHDRLSRHRGGASPSPPETKAVCFWTSKLEYCSPVTESAIDRLSAGALPALRQSPPAPRTGRPRPPPRTLHAICLQYPITCSWNGGEYSHVIALIDPRTRRQQNTPAGTYEFLFIDFRPQSVFRQLDFPCLSRVTKLNIHVAGFSLTN